MKLKQLEIFRVIVENNFNVSVAAKHLELAQPGLSRQIQNLEYELGIELFVRQGRRFVGLTPPGEEVFARVQSIDNETHSIERIAAEAQEALRGELRIGTPHTQARYVLPPAINQLKSEFPEVSVHLYQGTPEQLADLTIKNKVDFSIATEGFEHFDDLILLPCFTWNRSIVVPKGHPLSHLDRPIELADLAEEQLVTYVFGFASNSLLSRGFQDADIDPNVAFTATDTDIIKTYIREGHGIGIIASMAYDGVRDRDLQLIDASHLFENSTTQIAFKKGSYLRRFVLRIVELYAPNLNQKQVQKIVHSSSISDREQMIRRIQVPHR